MPTRKLHLTALRGFFDALVLRHVVMLNPASSVRAERHSVVEGKTPEIAIDHARTLLASIDVDNVDGLRDTAVIAVLIYTAYRIRQNPQADRRRGDGGRPQPDGQAAAKG